jgi:hypothetical protein
MDSNAGRIKRMDKIIYEFNLKLYVPIYLYFLKYLTVYIFKITVCFENIHFLWIIPIISIGQRINQGNFHINLFSLAERRIFMPTC